MEFSHGASSRARSTMRPHSAPPSVSEPHARCGSSQHYCVGVKSVRSVTPSR